MKVISPHGPNPDRYFLSGPLERFPAKHARGLDPRVETGSRQENASNQKSRAPFRFHRNGYGS
ncbi:hypothetical protein FFI89_004440 [Bradyrhizobium sp. KBS0727]|nr:hypothetical protein FFI71_004440 [Bradyrhizobium sp. KBS0725]QDW43057.1 hypothetical protein FFI89_004440 [Bradyrhizobium sp. KBS0727]